MFPIYTIQPARMPTIETVRPSSLRFSSIPTSQGFVQSPFSICCTAHCGPPRLSSAEIYRIADIATVLVLPARQCREPCRRPLQRHGRPYSCRWISLKSHTKESTLVSFVHSLKPSNVKSKYVQTGTPHKSACNCISRLFVVITPSTYRRFKLLNPPSLRIDSRMSRV